MSKLKNIKNITFILNLIEKDYVLDSTTEFALFQNCSSDSLKFDSDYGRRVSSGLSVGTVETSYTHVIAA